MNQTISAAILSELGFESATRCTINQKLDRLSPSGGTALRDSVKIGLSLILKLNKALDELGTGEIWNFLHIVITDGQDAGSKTSIEELAAIFYFISQTIPTDRCQTNYIGINLDQKAATELALMSECGGDSCNAFHASNVDLGKIFERISVGIGIIRQTQAIGVTDGTNAALMIHQQNRHVLTVKQNKFAVLLNLDFSGSMCGANWKSLKSSVAAFLRNLQEGDLVSCLLFNNEVKLLSGMNIPPPPPPVRYNPPSPVRYDPPPSSHYQSNQVNQTEKKSSSGKRVYSDADSCVQSCKCNLF